MVARALDLEVDAVLMDPAGRLDASVLRKVGWVSASHHDDLTVFGLSRRCEIGIDVEPEFESGWDDAVEAVLTRRELAALRRLPADRQPSAYFECWTRKEAVMKALGEGLSDRAPSSLDITVPPESPALLSIDGAPPERAWTLVRFSPTAGYTGTAAAVETDEIDLRVQEWPADLSA